MYDRLREERLLVQKERAESLAKGRLEAQQDLLVKIVMMRFPSLVTLAQRRADQANIPGALDLLIQQVVIAFDENAVRRLLTFSGN